MPKYYLCDIDALAENTTRSFTVAVPSSLPESGPDCEEIELFAVKRSNIIYVYLNQCPHTGVTLNWQAHQFLDLEERWIQCATHGALFRVEDGLCIHGPCVGRNLLSLHTVLKDNQLYVEWPKRSTTP